MKQKSILQKLFNYMMMFGIAMGLVFPVYASFFVEWKEGYFIYFLLGCILAGITVGAVSYWFVKVILIKELLKVSEVAKRIRKKDLNISLNIKSDDAVGEIANGFQEVLSSLNILVNQIHLVSNQVIVLDRTTNSSKSENTIEDLNDTIEVVKVNTDSISQLSDNIRDEVRQIQLKVEKSGKQLAKIDKYVEEFALKMEVLTSQTEKINEIVNFVNSVASKTSLLALNASVEAAKAGEYGSSFGIVANEVQKLSANIEDYVIQINSIVEELNIDIKSANSIKLKISDLFKENLNENMRFVDVIKRVDLFATENLKENTELKNVVLDLKDKAYKINERFKVFNKSIVLLDKNVSNYKLNSYD